MLAGKKEPFLPQTLPLRRLQRSSFQRAHQQAQAKIHRFQALLASILRPQFLLASLMASEALAALESQKVKLSLEEFYLLCQTHAHPNKSLLQPIHYYLALKKACAAIQKHPIDKHLLCSIHQIVKKSAPPHIQAGDYRTKQNWIGKEGCKREDASFFPPAPKVMRAFMHNLLQYTQKQERDSLTQIAIIVAQLLILHPFMDGNGRTARILIPLLFHQKKILPFLFISRYLKDHRKPYFKNLFDITGKNKWEQWIRFFLKGVASQAHSETIKTKQIHTLYLKLQKRLAKHTSRTAPLTYLFEHPVFSRKQFITRYTTPLLTQLAQRKIVKPFKRGYYIFTPLLKLLKSKNPER
jgi:Fic family protein